MEIKGVNNSFISALFILLIVASFFLSTKAQSQTLELIVTGTNTFQIKVTNVYTWHVEEYVSGKWEKILAGSSEGTAGTAYARKGGNYTFRLYNCFNVANGCSTSSSKNVYLSGSAPTAPTISTSSGYTSISVSWTQPTGTSSFVFTRNGTQIGVSGRSYNDTAVTGGITYSYSVKGCNAYGECSAVASASAALAVNPATQTKTLTYSYDELGRLTFVSDPANGNRDYDYDKAGNRVLVSTNTLNDGGSEPGVVILPAPANPRYSLIASCAWRATWTAVSGAAKYRIADTSGATQFVTTTEAIVQCPVGNESGNKPRKVQACTVNNICGTDAFFN